ncbi:hypothetical protein IPG41_04905 [Candidatus Peregrinibacteria bacterium]|nr:MAG: hypothetical protein IPG41_04905 [Candidatus Peregrinibacteria bacterium]
MDSIYRALSEDEEAKASVLEFLSRDPGRRGCGERVLSVRNIGVSRGLADLPTSKLPDLMRNLPLHVDLNKKDASWWNGITVLWQPKTSYPRQGFTVAASTEDAKMAMHDMVQHVQLMESGRIEAHLEGELSALLEHVRIMIEEVFRPESNCSFVMGMRDAIVTITKCEKDLGFRRYPIWLALSETILDLIYSHLHENGQLLIQNWSLPENANGSLFFIDGRFVPDEDPLIVHGRWVPQGMVFKANFVRQLMV